jgi:ribosomal protein S3AE
MTRLEFQIASAVKECKKTGSVSLTQKAKTKDNYIYTIFDGILEPAPNESEMSFYKRIREYCCDCIEHLCRALTVNKFVTSALQEGRIISADNIKEIWIEFGSDEQPDIFLKETIA